MQKPQVDIISRETIKPSTPTPQDHRIHILSYMDRFQAPTYLPLLYFYTSATPSTKFGSAITENYLPKLNHLKRSLAETLAKYYPFAGRIRGGANINCSDDGVTVVEARIKCKMSQVLDDPQNEILDLLSVDGLPWETLNSTLISISSLLLVQISLFDCGGMAIGVCLNHKLGGAATLVKFMTDWATIARGDRDQVCPELTAAASTFPSDGLPVLNSEFSPTFPNVSPTKRFVFDASKIAALKALVADKVHKPTRTEVVTALIYKCAISALATSTTRSTSTSTNNDAMLNPDAPFTTTYLYQIMDLSARLTPPVPECCVGNATWTFLAASNDCNKVELHDIVLQMREAKNRFLEEYVKRLSGEEWPSVMREWLQQLGEVFTKIDVVNDEVLFRCSSWCRFPVYEVDFGWGKPTWVTIPSHNLKRNFYLIDARDGEGVEAFVNLTAEYMDVVERDSEFLAFATLNPPVNI